MKRLFLLLLIIAIGVFIYLKVQVMGDPNSKFNQTTRYSLARHSFLRTILGLHNAGDARSTFLSGTDPLAIVWFKPQTDEVDEGVLKKFVELVSHYTGRQVQLFGPGALDEGKFSLSNSSKLEVKNVQFVPPGTDTLLLVFAADYEPRLDQELSTTVGENEIALSLNSHLKFVNSDDYLLKKYLLSSLLHEFGHEIGLAHNTDPSCIMSTHAGFENKPLETVGQQDPQDYCSQEKIEIGKIQAQLKN